MTCYKEEIFGPALCVMYVDTLSEAIKIINEYFLFNIFLKVTSMETVVLYSRRVEHQPENSNLKSKWGRLV